ncbi:reverse transcriptase domain-containing protein [Tanacetum coccineum]
MHLLLTKDTDTRIFHLLLVDVKPLCNLKIRGQVFTDEKSFRYFAKHLKELEITNLSNMKGELDLVKFLLAKSPALKKLKILIYYKVDKDAEVPAQSVGSSNTDVLDSPCLLVLIIGTSQSKQHDKSESNSYYLSG